MAKTPAFGEKSRMSTRVPRTAGVAARGGLEGESWRVGRVCQPSVELLATTVGEPPRAQLRAIGALDDAHAARAACGWHVEKRERSR